MTSPTDRDQPDGSGGWWGVSNQLYQQGRDRLLAGEPTMEGVDMRRHVPAAIAIAATVFATASACPGTSSVPGQDILDLINGKRAEAGCPAVTGDDQLRVAADRHVGDMHTNPAVRSDPNHLGSDGSTPSQRIADAGFSPVSRTGEIMYWATGPPANTAQASVDWWMNSPPHRAIIETCEFTHAGVGLVYPGGVEWYTTVDFASH